MEETVKNLELVSDIIINSDEQCGVVYKTKEYSKFKSIKGNRRLNSRNYIKLVKSMQEEQLTIPIIVNEKFEIIDGQHRFRSIQELEKYVYYIMIPNYGISQVKRANLVSSNWTKEDYLHMYIEDGNEHYLIFNDIKKESGMNISDIIKLYAMTQKKSASQVSYEFESGIFNSDGTYEVKMFLMDLENFSFYKMYKTQSFVAAFLRLYTHSNYNHEKLIERLKTRRSALETMNGGTIDEYLACICNKIYSFGLGKDTINYDANNRKFY